MDGHQIAITQIKHKQQPQNLAPGRSVTIFIKTYKLPFMLLSDPDKKVMTQSDQ